MALLSLGTSTRIIR